VTTVSLGVSLTEGWRIILEGPAGNGKRTTLVQFGHSILSVGGLTFLVDLPQWASSHKKILSFVAESLPFAERGLDAALLWKLRGDHPITFLLNGWNEVSIAGTEAAMRCDYRKLGPRTTGFFEGVVASLRRATRVMGDGVGDRTRTHRSWCSCPS
jgi:hypothetical protein